MARLRVLDSLSAKLRTGGYKGEPSGTIELTENHKTYNVADYAEAETNIPDPVLIEKSVTENSTYSAQDYEADGFSKVTVNVPEKIPIDSNSQTPLYFGVKASGFVFSSNPADETPVAFGVNANGHPYVKGGAT